MRAMINISSNPPVRSHHHGSCALVKHISENPVRIWTRDDDGAAWFNLRVGRAVCCVMLRGAVRENTVKEIGLMIALPGCGA